MKSATYVQDTVVIIENEDGTWSVTDNGEETPDLDEATAIKYALEFVITQDDAEAWHNGDGMTDHLRTAWENLNEVVFQIWGSPEGPEPLSVVIER